jgi:hypothetical protein
MRLQTSRRTFNHLLLSAGAACVLDRPLHADAPGSGFAHPGMLHTAADLERMRAAVKTRQEPIFSGFEKLQAHPASQKSYVSKGAFAEVSRNPTVHADEFNKDSSAAYQCVLMWKVTGDRDYFDISSRILNDWSKTLKNIGGVDAILCAGLGPFLMANAAELLRHGGEWSATDSERFAHMLREAVLPVIENFAAFANGNWDTAAIKTMIAIAIYTDDRPLFERALTYYCHGCGDGRLANYIYPNGQCQESGRDQQHTQLGIAHMGDCCEMGWNQGIDLYAWLENRLLTGFEYTANYNLGGDVLFLADIDRTGKYRHTVISPRGPFRPIYEQIYNHYVHRRGIEAPFTQRAAAQIRPEGAGFQADQTGFGTLLYTRPPHPALPASGVPAALRADTIGISFVRPASTSTVTVERAEHPAGPFLAVATRLTGTSCKDATAKPSQLYFYRAIDDVSRRASPPVAHMAGLPNGWQQGTLGALRGTPAAAFDGQAFRLNAAGALTTQSRPSGLFFVHRALGATTTVTARLNPPIASQSLRAGIAIATSASLPTLCAALLVSPTGGPAEHPHWTASLETLTSTEDQVALPALAIANGRIMAPVWLRLERSGTTLQASTSGDGQKWIAIGSVEIPDSQLQIGLALESGLADVETEISFDQVKFGTGNGTKRP